MNDRSKARPSRYLHASNDRPRAILIGTQTTVLAARDQFTLLPNGPDIIGCVLTDSASPSIGWLGQRQDLKVLGAIDHLPRIVASEDVTLAIVSLPIAMGASIAAARSAIRRAGIAERFLPTLQDVLDEAPPWMIGLGGAEPSATSPSFRAQPRIDLADLIGRNPHLIDKAAVAKIIRGKRVLITGAGGSIGSELARVVAEFGPSQLQLMERAENALFDIDAQIARRSPTIERRRILHDVVDAEGTLRLLVDLRPQVIFHAAAHKHVPLMEDHPSHAVTNNVFGTKSIADAAVAVGAERFVFVSTDKAVNPTSVMGATKRLAERYIHTLQASSARSFASGNAGTRFSIVRFGNVLGSACSVLTIWSTQLAEGGPITVTDPRMTRFFMTIPEAATLVIQSAALDHPQPSSADRFAGSSGSAGAAVYVLDMGDPIAILDLARRFVRVHGFEPRTADDAPSQASRSLPPLDIEFTGIRPGEKLYEELAYETEELGPTAHPGIRAWRGAANELTRETLEAAAMIAELSAVRSTREREQVLNVLRRWVPEMASPNVAASIAA